VTEIENRRGLQGPGMYMRVINFDNNNNNCALLTSGTGCSLYRDVSIFNFSSIVWKTA